MRRLSLEITPMTPGQGEGVCVQGFSVQGTLHRQCSGYGCAGLACNHQSWPQQLASMQGDLVIQTTCQPAHEKGRIN